MPVVVKAGEGSFHDSFTWHGSAPNTNGTVAGHRTPWLAELPDLDT